MIYVIGRDDDVARLLSLAESGHNATLFAPRRYGKTSLLRQLLDAAERQADMLTVLVDFSDVLSDADVAARLEQSYRTLRGPLERFVANHLQSVGIGTPAGGLVRQRPPRPDPISAIHDARAARQTARARGQARAGVLAAIHRRARGFRPVVNEE